MASIDSRLAALAEAVERQKTEQEQPLDDLSLSLYQMETEMAAMTETDIEAMAQEVDEDGRQLWTLEAAQAFVNQWKQMKDERSPRKQRRIDRAIAAKGGWLNVYSFETGPPPHDTKPNLIMTDHGSVERFEARSKGQGQLPDLLNELLSE